MDRLLANDLPSESSLREFCKWLPGIVGTSLEPELTRECPRVLNKLLEAANHPSISVGHRGVAISTLSSLLDHGRRTALEPFIDESTWCACVNVLLDQSDHAKPKVLRQLLLSLTNVLATFPQDARTRIFSQLLENVMQIILQQSDLVNVKPALQTLNHLIAKGVVSMRMLLEQFRQVLRADVSNEEFENSNLSTLGLFLETLLHRIRYPATAIVASQVFCTVIDVLQKDDALRAGDAHLTWTPALLRVLRAHTDDLRGFRSQLLPDLFKSHPPAFRSLISLVGLGDILGITSSSGSDYRVDEPNIVLLFICLEVGKEIGLVVETTEIELHMQGNVLHVPETLLVKLLNDASDSVRLAGLGLIISTPSMTRPLSPTCLRHLERGLSHLLMETDVYVRGEILVQLQHLIDRIKAATGPLARSATKTTFTGTTKPVNGKNQTTTNNHGHLLTIHRDFLPFMLATAKSQLQPAAPYQRHVAGLRLLTMLAKSGLDSRVPRRLLSKQAQAKGAASWPFHECVFDARLTRLLQDLLMDPFEDVRSLASALLVVKSSIPKLGNDAAYAQFIGRAEVMTLQSGRADHADGVSRAAAIVFEAADLSVNGTEDMQVSREDMIDSLIGRVEARIQLARKNMSVAIQQFPLHSAFASIRLIFDDPKFYETVPVVVPDTWRKFHDRIVVALHEVWVCVHDVLCNDAPEGYVPDELDEDFSISTKDILSYCWRALKEASALLRVLVLKAPIGEQHRSMLSNADFLKLVRLSFLQMTELRHRGAFSAVAQSFTACCSRLSKFKKNDVLHDMFMETTSAIQAKGSATTRRSAGLPSVVVGLLSASPSDVLFGEAIATLITEAAAPVHDGARYGDSLPQVHALNCLRAIFINTTLGQHTELYIGSCLTLAGRCLTIDVWPIRNCGLMLFRALIDRLLGSADSQNWSDESLDAPNPRVSYLELPEVFDIVLQLLTPEAHRLESAHTALESVFPALKLVQRLPPPADRREDVSALVLKLCKSPHWHVREMAARTYATLITSSERCVTAGGLVPQLKLGQNVVHGQLLCILWLIKLQTMSNGLDAESIHMLAGPLLQAKPELDTNNACPYTRALYLDIENIVFIHQMRLGLLRPSEYFANSADFTSVLQESPAVRSSRALNILLGYISRAANVHDDNISDVDGDLAGYLLWLRLETPETSLQVLQAVVKFMVDLPKSVLEVIVNHLSLFSKYGENKNIRDLSSTRSLLVQFHASINPDSADALPHLDFDDMKKTFSGPTTPSPAIIETTVLLWGSLINQACRASTYAEETTLSSTIDLAVILQTLIEESQPFDLRIAAARSIEALSSIWSLRAQDALVKASLDRVHGTIILLVYDLLNDDDEEIRHSAVDIASTILSKTGDRGRGDSLSTRKVVPLLSGQRLIVHLITHYAHLPQLFEEAVLRVTGMGEHETATAAFVSASSNRSSLFAVEKQNLFVDPVREAILWSQALRRLPLAIIKKSASRVWIRKLTQWAHEAMNLVYEKLTGEDGEDGVLGWTHKPEMFVFGIRLWCVIDLIFSWRRQIGLSSEALLVRMVEIASLGDKQELHPLWMQKIERLVTKEMRQRMRMNGVGKTWAPLSIMMEV